MTFIEHENPFGSAFTFVFICYVVIQCISASFLTDAINATADRRTDANHTKRFTPGRGYALIKPHLNHTAAVVTVFGCSRASKSKRRLAWAICVV